MLRRSSLRKRGRGWSWPGITRPWFAVVVMSVPTYIQNSASRFSHLHGVIWKWHRLTGYRRRPGSIRWLFTQTGDSASLCAAAAHAQSRQLSSTWLFSISKACSLQIHCHLNSIVVWPAARTVMLHIVFWDNKSLSMRASYSMWLVA